MSEQQICHHCKKVLNSRGNSKTVYFTNTTLDKVYTFCNKKCKINWLTEMKLKKELKEMKAVNGENKFYCTYCESEWDTNRGKTHHERHCPENPNKPKKRSYSIEEIREIDKVFGLTDAQIAKFIRNYKFLGENKK